VSRLPLDLFNVTNPGDHTPSCLDLLWRNARGRRLPLVLASPFVGPVRHTGCTDRFDVPYPRKSSMVGCPRQGMCLSGSTVDISVLKLFFVAIQEGEATRILCKYHANGADEHHPLVVFEMAQIRHAVRMDKETDVKTSWASLVSTPGNRRRMIIIIALAVFSQWRYVGYSRRNRPSNLDCGVW